VWQSFSTVVLAGIGAFIANFAAKFIESWVRRSQQIETQRDADLHEIVATVKLIGELSEKFWTKSAAELGTEDLILQSHLKAEQHHLAEVIAEIFSGTDKWDCDIQVHKLATVATGGNFGEPDREAEPGRLAEILITVRALTREAKKGRRRLKRRLMA